MEKPNRGERIMQSRNLFQFAVMISLLFALGQQRNAALAADHGDTPLLKSVGRHDARIADLLAFLRGDNLVLALTVDPTAPLDDGTPYLFAPDITFKLSIDNESEVRFDDPDDLLDFGGTITRPGKIQPRITFTLTFDNDGNAQLKTGGLEKDAKDRIELFAGLRDDAFIRRPRTGKNIAAIVLEFPLADVLGDTPTLLIWATAKVDDINGPFQELAGRALRSQFPENDQMNTLKPKHHFKVLGVPPDVIIFDTSLPAAFPNGRELTDDVVDLVGDPRLFSSEAPTFPSTNDVPFLTTFPYLAPPH